MIEPTGSAPQRQLDLDAALARARDLSRDGGRRIIGITGPPGTGKSTLAGLLLESLAPAAALVPMDGYHLADVQLERLGRLGRKGAPDTFDGYGYLSMLERLRRPEAGVTVYAPAFERTLEQPIAGSIAVSADVGLVLTEGNYLLLDQAPWTGVRDLLDEIWWVDSDPALRHRRLVDRHVSFGKPPAAAQQWVEDVDEANARLLAPGRAAADVVIAPLPPLPTGGPPAPAA